MLNTWFAHDENHPTSWIHCRWGSKGAIDMALGRFSDWHFVSDTHALPGAEVASHHRLMVLKLRAAPGSFTPPPETPAHQPSSQTTSWSVEAISMFGHGWCSR